MNKWKKVANSVRIAAVAVLVALVGFVGYQVYDFYHVNLGNSPVHVTQDYFKALGEGNFARAYELTNPASLTGLYGRRATQSEVYQAFTNVVGSQPRPFSSITVTRMAHRGGYYYMQARLVSPTGAVSRVVVELTKVGGNWRVTFPFGLMP